MKTVFDNSQPGVTKVSHVHGIGSETINPSGPPSTSESRPIIGDRVTPEYMGLLAAAYLTNDALEMCRRLWEILTSKQAVKEALGEAE